MRLPDYLFRPDPGLQQSYLENYSPGFMQMAGVAFDDSFGTSSLGLVSSIAEMQKAAVEEEAERFEDMADWKARILGVGKNEIL